jgi:hypothetical protein
VSEKVSGVANAMASPVGGTSPVASEASIG